MFVTGGPGRGKTALMREFARRAMDAHPDLLVAGGNCNAYSGVGDPYLPFREVLGMLTGDVEARWAAGTISREHARQLWTAFPLAAQALVDHGPSLIGTILSDPALLFRATAVAPEGAGWLPELGALSAQERAGHRGLEQSALFHQFTNVLRSLAETHPLLLMLDDLQWADSASIGLLFHLGRRLEGSRILIACAYRPEEVAMEREGPSAGSGRRERHPLEKTLAEFKRSFGDVWVDLRRADEMEGRSFVDGFLDIESNRLGEGFRKALFAHAGGHPLFTVEVLWAMQERGDLAQDADGRWVTGLSLDWERLPARVEAVIAERVGRLDADLRDVLAVASVEGERFTAQVVAQVQDTPEREMLQALSRELGARHRLVREGEDVQIDGQFLSRYQFAHALFQEYLYGALSAGERRLLHGEIAAALEELYGDRTAEIVAQLAHHYDAAGRAEKAVEYSLRTGDQARLAYANEEAMAYFHRVLMLLDGSPLGESRKDWRLEALKGLGQVCLGTGKLAEAEERFREAIALGREMGLVPRELVRLYHWLGDVLWWQDRHDDQIRIGEEGLAFLGGDAASAEAALMNLHMALGHWHKRDMERYRELTYRTAQFIQRLPYAEELRPAYLQIAVAYKDDKDVEEAMKWLQALEEKATPHHDLRALGSVHGYTGWTLAASGDSHRAISRYQQALELFARIGDTVHESQVLAFMGEVFLWLGDLQRAEEYARRGLETAKAVGHKRYLVGEYRLVGQICLSQGAGRKAVGAFQKATQLLRETRYRGEEGAETKWFLELTEPPDFPQSLVHDGFVEPLSLGRNWVWHDLFDDCSFTVRNGLEIHAANGRDLWHINLSAPRLLRPVSPVLSGDLAVQTVCVPVSEEKPAIGGLLLWKDKENYLRLDRGTRGEREISFGGCLANQDVIIGRGRIPIDKSADQQMGKPSGRVFLRLERVVDRVNALCSADGVSWFTVGHVAFPAEDPLQVGLHAIGNIDRTIYRGAYSDGTAIRFESFQLWGTWR